MKYYGNSKPPRPPYRPPIGLYPSIERSRAKYARIRRECPNKRSLMQFYEQLLDEKEEKLRKADGLPPKPRSRSNIIDLKKCRTAARSDLTGNSEIETPAIPILVFRSGQAPKYFNFVVLPEYGLRVTLDDSAFDEYVVRRVKHVGTTRGSASKPVVELYLQPVGRPRDR